MADTPSASVKKIAGILAVILLFVAGTGLLMTSLQSAKMAAVRSKMASELSVRRYERMESPAAARTPLGEANKDGTSRIPEQPAALVKTFVAEIDLTPKLSVGTDRPESIYAVKFHAAIAATRPAGATQDCRLELPLPPQLISLADLNVTVNGDPTESLTVDEDKLVWTGRLDETTPAKVDVTYSAMGKGIYTLMPPRGKIVDVFEAKLVAHQSNIRMLELSLQPESTERTGGKTTYAWNYKRLMYGRPIALDVLGIAPMDRLGDLGWLGPISVLVFGLLVAMLGLAFRPDRLDKWMLLLIIGAFAGAYPLMYFLQDFLAMPTALLAAVVPVLAVIGLRAVTLMGAILGLLGTVVLAAAVQGLAISATLWPETQGLLLTVLAVGTLVLAMLLLPRVQRNMASGQESGAGSQ